MGRHTPTRIDIRTQGWTSGLDILPLPRECQTALCIHKDHQLTTAKDTALDAAFIVDAALEAVEPASRGWVMPSPGLFPDLPPLDLPTISIRRGGLRHWPMLPTVYVRIARRRYWSRWMVLARTGGGPEMVIGRWWGRKTARQHADMVKKLNEDVYTSIKDHVIQHGW